MDRNVKRILLTAGTVALAGSAWSQTETKPKLPTAQPVTTGAPTAARPSPITMPVKPAMLDLSKGDWRFAHPKPDLLLSINVGKIVHSPYMAESIQKSFGMTSDVDKAKIDLAMKMIGTVDRVQISLRATQVKNDPDFLVLVTGALDPMVKSMMMQPSKGSAVVAREISPSAILFGKASLIDQAARRMSGATAPVIADSLSSSDFWIAGDTGMLKGAAPTQLPPGLDSLKHFALGLNFGDPLEFNANLSMLNEDGAEKLIAMYNFLAAQSATTPQAMELAKATKVERKGTEVQFRFSAPMATIQEQMMSAAAAAGAGAGATGMGMGQLPALMGMLGMSTPGGTTAAAMPHATTVSAPAPVKAPQNPGKIMIYGLDDGPREVGAPKKSD